VLDGDRTSAPVSDLGELGVLTDGTSASVAVTKLGAASRLLAAAIRSFLADEDLLATYVIVSASFRVMRDIAEQRGHDHLEDAFELTAFYLGRDYLSGTLPQFAREDEQLTKLAKLVGEGIRSGELKSPADVTVFLPPTLKGKIWRGSNAAYNFLKHADRDPAQSLDLSGVNVKDTVLQACRLFDVLLPQESNWAVKAFEFYYVWSSGASSGQQWMQPLFDASMGLADEEVRERLLSLSDRGGSD
jgi:hypothetical protein